MTLDAVDTARVKWGQGLQSFLTVSSCEFRVNFQSRNCITLFIPKSACNRIALEMIGEKNILVPNRDPM